MRIKRKKAFTDARVISIDTETTGLDPWAGNKPFAFSFANDRLETRYVEFDVDPFTREPKPTKAGLKLINQIVRCPAIKTLHHEKFDRRHMKMAFGIEILGFINDTMFMAHSCKSDDPRGLKWLAAEYCDIDASDEKALRKAVSSARRYGRKHGWKLGEKLTSTDDEIAQDYWVPAAVWKHNPEFAAAKKLPRWKCKKYAVLDAIRTIKLFLMYEEWMQSDEFGAEQATETYAHERELWPIVDDMETQGMPINMKVVNAKAKVANKFIKKIKAHFPGVNLNPSNSLKDYLWTKKGLNLKIVKWTSDKSNPNHVPQPCFDKYVKEYYSKLSPEVAEITEYGHVKKLVGTYLHGYKQRAQHIKDDVWVIHPNMKQVGADTARFSITNPALQTIPNRNKESLLYQARAPFGPLAGRVWWSMDYRQIEARIFAEEAQEQIMLEAFAQGRDVYAELAKVITELTGMGTPRNPKIKDEKKDKAFQEWRDTTKHNFLGRLYGMGKDLMALRLGVELSLAYKVLDAFNETFPRVNLYMRELMNEVKDSGHIITRYNRLLPIDPGQAYKAVAYKCQSTARDLITRAMIKIDGWFKKIGASARIVLPIHDELIISADNKHRTKPFLRKIRDLMQDNDGMFEVETLVDVARITKSWANPVEITL